MKLLLLTPPMTQLNTPYPATAYLTGFLREKKYTVVQSDPALELFLKLFSKTGLDRVRESIRGKHPSVKFFIENFSEYSATIDGVIRFLQGKHSTLAYRIISRDYLPEGARFKVFDELQGFSGDAESGDSLGWAFGSLGIHDRAKHIASLYIDDLADIIRDGIDDSFALSRYGEKLAASQPTFTPISEKLSDQPSLIDEMIDEIVAEQYKQHLPNVVGMSIPFPGNVYGAFRMAKAFKEKNHDVKIILGGGYPNTELRNLSDPQVFEYVDAITLDDGERPFLCLLEHYAKKRKKDDLFRTFILDEGKVKFINNLKEHDIPHKDIGTPVYDGLPLDQYISLFEMLNPMHRIWSDGRWNKITLAHGCYWKKCNFCDITLDYIGRYDAAPAKLIFERMEAIAHETNQTGFHFVDEAAPPALLRSLSELMIEKKSPFTWWGNIRFEKAFTAELCQKMAQGGCMAISGGLEVASDRLLKLMQKGVTVEQVAKVTKAFTDNGILVHAYLMYGFPTQTVQETIDALERVRQLFYHGCIQSAFWHRFSATIHSPIGQNPEQFGIKLKKRPKVTFAENDLAFIDSTGVDHDELGVGLNRALYNYMHGMGLDEDVRTWFSHMKKVPHTTISETFIAAALKK